MFVNSKIIYNVLLPKIPEGRDLLWSAHLFTPSVQNNYRYVTNAQ